MQTLDPLATRTLDLGAAPSPELIDTRVEVIAPENIAFRYSVAGPFRRLPAFLIDVAVRIALWLGGMSAFLFAAPELGEAVIGVAVVLWFGLDWGYGAAFETLTNGRTPGKWLSGLRVVGVDGRPINALQAMLRNVLRSADLLPIVPWAWLGAEAPSLPIPIGLIGLATASATRRRQRLGDLAAGTIVVVAENRRPRKAPAFPATDRVAQIAGRIPAKWSLHPRTAAAIAQYVDRRARLSPARREEAATSLGAALRRQPGLAALSDEESLTNDLLLCALYHRMFAAQPVDAPGPNTTLVAAGATP